MTTAAEDSASSQPTGPLAQGARLERVATAGTWLEGPVWLPHRRCVRFSDIPGNRILEFSEDTGETSVYCDAAEFTNGRTLDLDGHVVQCSHGRRAVERDTGRGVSTLVDTWRGVRFNSPNDVVVKSDGTIWFTDPSYGIKKAHEGHPGECEYGDHYVFRLDPATGHVDPVVIDVEMPNGLAFSPDESLLYVADSSVEPPTGVVDPARPGGHALHVYDVYAGRHCKNGRTFAEVSPGLPDGFRVDVDGNVWTSSADSVQVFSPAGERIGRIPVPEVVSNVCFGGDDGRTLYVTATTSLYRIRTTTTDAVTVARSRTA
ncbi:gluconolactonase [Kineococcus xinjiangensis]|uniref:Gluconolactonase n=1 Tax=Kineococcus xinjiangensis TaxID=512762 RepID=A0A2S6IK76_9ACTN|nr:SMP-30/gluconolactonase/LRE family protein [Kineococcus xinjiangensis]PPK94609.1 gluconolactonase [Kineococcus xinjiangensis]